MALIAWGVVKLRVFREKILVKLEVMGNYFNLHSGRAKQKHHNQPFQTYSNPTLHSRIIYSPPYHLLHFYWLLNSIFTPSCTIFLNIYICNQLEAVARLFYEKIFCGINLHFEYVMKLFLPHALHTSPCQKRENLKNFNRLIIAIYAGLNESIWKELIKYFSIDHNR